MHTHKSTAGQKYSKTKLLILNSPSNPTGAVYRRETLEKIAKIAVKKNFMILSDEIYEKLTYDAAFPHVSIASFSQEVADLTITVNGFSKAYSMTGWRIGYAAGPVDLIDAMCTIQSQSTSNPTSISQVAAEVALTGDQSFIGKMCVEFKHRHDYVVAELNSIDGIECIPTDGTFYVFPNVEKLIARLPGIDDDLGFSEYLIENAGVALVPGSAFGCPGHIRISIATSMSNLENALARIKQAVA